MLLVAFCIDERSEEDYAFWGYFFGLLAFWGGLSLMESGSEWGKALYCLINVGLMLLSVLLQRRVFMVFGAMGVFGYLGYLSYDVFKDSLMFPFALSFLGVLIIALGIWYQRRREAIEQVVLGLVPASVQAILPKTRGRHSNSTGLEGGHS
jgi:ABC-type molybdate transport system permease subunit